MASSFRGLLHLEYTRTGSFIPAPRRSRRGAERTSGPRRGENFPPPRPRAEFPEGLELGERAVALGFAQGQTKDPQAGRHEEQDENGQSFQGRQDLGETRGRQKAA